MDFKSEKRSTEHAILHIINEIQTNMDIKLDWKNKIKSFSHDQAGRSGHCIFVCPVLPVSYCKLLFHSLRLNCCNLLCVKTTVRLE